MDFSRDGNFLEGESRIDDVNNSFINKAVLSFNFIASNYILICANSQQAVAHHRRSTVRLADVRSANSATDPSRPETPLLQETQPIALNARKTSDDSLHL